MCVHSRCNPAGVFILYLYAKPNAMKISTMLLFVLLFLDLSSQQGYKTLRRITVTPSTGTVSPAVDLANPPAKVYLFTSGTVSLSQNLIVTSTNTPPNDIIAEVQVFWRPGTILLNGHGFSLFGTNVTQDFLNTFSTFTFDFYNNTSLLLGAANVPLQDTAVQPVASLIPSANVGDKLITINANGSNIVVWSADSGGSQQIDTLTSHMVTADTLSVKQGASIGSTLSVGGSASLNTLQVINQTTLGSGLSLNGLTLSKPSSNLYQAILIQENIDSVVRDSCATIDVCNAGALLTNYFWNLTGNAGTDPATNFLGTTDAEPILFKTNNFTFGYLGVGGTGNIGFGYRILNYNTSGILNIAIGSQALSANTSGSNNTAVGSGALGSSSTDANNIAIGNSALANTGGGSNNLCIGNSAGITNTTNAHLVIIGNNADVSIASGITNAAAIGDKAFVGASNSMVLGSIAGVNTASANTNVGIGVIAPASRLEVAGHIMADSAVIFEALDSVELDAFGLQTTGATYYCSDCHNTLGTIIGGLVTWTGSLWRRGF